MTAFPLDEWRARALRYTLIYLALSVTLMGVRFVTKEVRPDLLALRNEREVLRAEKRDLEVALQTATSVARVQAWARENKMIDFARASKETGAFSALPDPAPLPERRDLEVKTTWR